MTEAILYTQDGKRNGAVPLPKHLFTLPWSPALMHQVITGIAANERAGTAHAKGRSEVRGGGRKPWRQKGTGRARHGSIRSPLWVGGGVTFGPSRDKKYAATINRKMRTKALFTALSEKVRQDAVLFLESFSVDSPSTKTAAAFVMSVCGETAGKRNVCTVVFADNDPVARKSFRNIPGVRVSALDALNAANAFAARRIIFINPNKTLESLTERGGRVVGDGSAKEKPAATETTTAAPETSATETTTVAKKPVAPETSATETTTVAKKPAAETTTANGAADATVKKPAAETTTANGAADATVKKPAAETTRANGAADAVVKKPAASETEQSASSGSPSAATT